MNWVIAATGSVLSLACLTAAATMSAFQSARPVADDGPITFSLVDDAPIVMTRLDSMPSFDLIAMTDSVGMREVSKPTAKSSRRVVFFTQESCPPCKKWEAEIVPKLTSNGWTVTRDPTEGLTAHVQIVDMTDNPSLAQECGIEGTPAFARIVDGKPEAVMYGQPDSWRLKEFYQGGCDVCDSKPCTCGDGTTRLVERRPDVFYVVSTLWESSNDAGECRCEDCKCDPCRCGATGSTRRIRPPSDRVPSPDFEFTGMVEPSAVFTEYDEPQGILDPEGFEQRSPSYSAGVQTYQPYQVQPLYFGGCANGQCGARW